MKKKILIAAIALVLALTPAIQPAPTAHAIFGLGDIVLDPGNLFQNIWQNFLGPALASALKKQILDRVVDQVIVAIQGGGKPQFVTDWKGFLAEAENAAGGEFIRGMGGGFLCSPFSLQLQLALLPVRQFYNQQAQCTLSQIVGNIQAFYSDFRNGGWIAYGTSWMPQNNFLGSFLVASAQLNIEKSVAAAKGYNEAMAGDGFLSTKDKNGNIVTPGSTVSSVVAEAVGSGIPFILSGQDVGSYAGAIVSAMINRAFGAGLAAIKPSSSQNQLDAANAAYEASLVANAFNGERDAALGDIESTRGPRAQAQSAIDTTIAKLNQFKTNLTQISADLTATGRSTCGIGIVVSTVQAQIAADLALIDPAIAQLQTAGTDNKTILDPLNAAVTEINSLKPSRAAITRMDEIRGNIFPLLDSTAASDFLASVQSQTNPINSDITAKTAAYKLDLFTCQH